MKKREIHWSNAVTTSGEVTFTPVVEKKQLVMTSGSLPLPTKAERKKAKKKSIVFVPNQTTTASNFSLKEIKRINSIPRFVLAAEPGSAWKMAYNMRTHTRRTVYSTYSFPENMMQFIDPRDKDFDKNSIYFFIKRVGNQSIFMTMSGKLFAFALEDKDIKNLIERAF